MTNGLLLLHAFPMDASMWSPQVSDLDEAVPIVAPNVPGFGGSTLSNQTSTMEEIADRAAEDLTAAGIDRAVVVGLSMGGYAALSFWRRHRDRVLGMVLANTRSGADDEAGRERRKALAERLKAEGNGFMVQTPPPLLSATASQELWDGVRDIIRAQPAEAIAAASLGMAERADSTPDLAGIDVPTLVITSTADTLIPPEATTPMADQVPGARLEIIEGAGHLSNLEAPEEFNRLLREHLERTGLLG
jgi:pimeloyl-ACP methyl ester carboxylesterase